MLEGKKGVRNRFSWFHAGRQYGNGHRPEPETICIASDRDDQTPSTCDKHANAGCVSASASPQTVTDPIFPRPHDEVPVSSHDAKRQKPSAGASHRFLKHRLERDEVFVLRKDRHPRVRTVQQMINPTPWS